jgi:hypothetical protein
MTDYFRFWHETDEAMQSPHVSCWGMNGPGSNAPQGPRLTQLGHGMNGKAINSGVKVRIYLISMC